jgi:membrane protease YdiL (CAAX protease family)
MSTKQKLSPIDAQTVPPWPIHQAVIAGCLGVIATLAITLWAAMAFPRQELSHRDFLAIETILECVASAGAVCLFLAIAWKLPLRDFWDSIHWHWKSSIIVVCSVIGVLSSVLMHFALVKNLAVDPISSGARLIASLALGTIILQPLIEEIYFRGILFESLSFKMGPLWSICVVTAVFVVMHARHHWTVLPIAIVLGVTRIATRSTACCFALHASYNLGMVVWELSSATGG